MKVLLYSGSLKIVNKSGIGQAVRQQEKSLKLLGIPYTMDSRDDFDIIHLNTIFPDSRIMSIMAKRKSKKVIYYAHSTMEDFKNSFRGSNLLAPIFKKWIIYCYNSADIVITPTEYSKMLLESYGLKRPIFSLSNGVDIDYFERNYDARKRFRDKYDLKEQEKVIISVGHYIERKGILDFVKIAEQMPEYQFYWFGYTNSHLVPHSVREIIENSLPNLHFPGYVNRNDLRDAYCGSDLFLFLTHEETEGIVLLEALASKIPVLIRDIPVYKDWLSDGETVYKGITIYDFKEKITQILEGILPDITKSGYRIAEQRDLKVIGRLLINIYDQ
ncbi:1,2-diacylglycerol-3-alpha-glucose alpha-1,2-glucosyltransferase [Carnobacterium alterfunditum]|uniref:1,2-diacylglycerol-3-alpha-glucose alpha-1,2-glucosyltransferase n=1 Tax=Carnobacterium alterfunditum TaxID=28230 RepID=A0A1N6F205_9LACT|nr:glycosyltransferase [Carnobacterium alterfunditum]SIN89256.1 1,2-diacylglycerol-3-alpha-glucose alpha-1,2-glucosyltransferase [Carnobacterium alterfunditum]